MLWPIDTELRVKRGRLGTQPQERYCQGSKTNSKMVLNWFKTDKKEHNRKQVFNVQPRFANQNPELKEVYLEPSTKRQKDKTEALVSLC